MVIRYLRQTLRNIWQNKVNAFISLFGLSLALASCMVIILFIYQELTFDRFHQKGDRIVRLINIGSLPGGDKRFAKTFGDMGPLLHDHSPGIEQFVRVSSWGEQAISHGEKKFQEKLFIAGPRFFDIFNFPFIEGDPRTALENPSSIVLTRSLVKTIFGDEKAFGKTLVIDGKHPMMITGIIEDVPENSHLQFNLVVSLDYMQHVWGADRFRKGQYLTSIYFLLGQNARPESLQAQISDFVKSHFTGRRAQANQYILQPLKSIHMTPGLLLDDAQTGHSENLYYFSMIALFIVIIASVNWINFMTAHAMRRTGEVGIRKSFGATRTVIMQQFITESILRISISFVLAIMIAGLVLPFINRVFQLHLKLDPVNNISPLLYLCGLTLLVSMISMIYPALLMSNFQPIEVMKGIRLAKPGKKVMQKSLIVVQFIAALVIIVYTLVMTKQMMFIQNRELGFKQDNLIYFSLREMPGSEDALKNDLIRNPNIKNAAVIEYALGRTINVTFPFTVTKDGLSTELHIPVHLVGSGYFETLEVPLVRGRDFSSERTADIENTVVVNESAAKLFGWENPVGKKIHHQMHNKDLTIIGTVPDFHVEPLFRQIQPCIFYYYPGALSEMLVRIKPEAVSETINFIREKWLEYAPNHVFTYQFVEDKILEAYHDDRNIGSIFRYASIFALLISSLGLLGLVLISVEKRKKEIGIRKTLGASVNIVVLLIIREYLSLLVVSSLIALPLAYFLSSRWIQSYAYRVELGMGLFILAAFIVFMVACVTVSYSVVRAALSNPVDSLRYE